MSAWIGDRVSEYHDFLVYVGHSAPDAFPTEDYLAPHEQMTLRKAFDELVGAFSLLKQRVKDTEKLEVLREMLAMSLEFYLAGDATAGARTLQEFESIVWPKFHHDYGYASVAQKRLRARLKRSE
jgi:hypothetical protein